MALFRQLILPAEIRSRELDARILQGLLAMHQGWRVVLGSKAMINRNIWRFANGIYLCQTLTKRRVAMLRILDKLGIPSVGWCEEGLVYQSREVYLLRRVAPQTLSKLSAVVAWGEQSKEDIDVVASPLGRPARPLGNPRLDLLRPELRSLHDEEVNEIKKKFGGFILVNTNFSNVNWAPECAPRNRRAEPARDRSQAVAADHFEAFRHHRREILEHFVKMVPDLARRFRGHTIVVRPHPAEDTEIWKRVARERDNIVVHREGPIAPWIQASKAVVHNGCTTAVEASLMDRCPIAFRPVIEPGLEAVLSNDVSHGAGSLDELRDMVQMCITGDLTRDDAQETLLEHYVSSRRGPLASERIIDLFDEVAQSVGAKAWAMARHAFKTIRPDHRTDRYMSTMFPVTSVDFVERRCAKMLACLGLPYDNVRVQSLGPNIFTMSVGKP